MTTGIRQSDGDGGGVCQNMMYEHRYFDVFSVVDI